MWVYCTIRVAQNCVLLVVGASISLFERRSGSAPLPYYFCFRFLSKIARVWACGIIMVVQNWVLLVVGSSISLFERRERLRR